MSLKVIGSGLGRTGTMSLKVALEHLLDGRCYHMTELFQHLDAHVSYWQAAANGEAVDWKRVFRGYVAAVDEPVACVWDQLALYYPDALVIHSERDVNDWWQSARETIFKVKIDPAPDMAPERRAWLATMLTMYSKIYPHGFVEEEAAKSAYLAHNERVKLSVPEERLLVWQVDQGWEPICRFLDLPVPGIPFPRSNTREQFKDRREVD